MNIDNPAFQTHTVIAIVILCAAWLVLRVWMKRKTPGCGSSECGRCPADDFKKNLAKKK